MYGNLRAHDPTKSSSMNHSITARPDRVKRRVIREKKKLCIACGRAPMALGRVHCEKCLTIYRYRSARNTAYRKAKGRCLTSGCKDKASDGHKLCGQHLLDMRESARVRVDTQKQAGLCIQSCGRLVEFKGRIRCITCETESRMRVGLEPLPRYIRTAIKCGVKLFRFREVQEFLRARFCLLSEKEQRILSIVYALDGEGRRRTLTSASKAEGVSPERVRQIHDRAMRRIIGLESDDELPVALVPTKARLQRYEDYLDQRLSARKKAQYAVRKGKIPRQPRCSQCGSSVRVEGHHPDYDKPLEVEWLCRKCHDDEHRQDKQERPAA